ncbi:Bug family tripartite tricarboxylate transporter substrate binding protein [Roseomonas sp. CCTCC AB2023176]|uniref:Bug family tripartite tricarboxylate transporter substrate binding protein n=1 Tax=Roseomonas sp. CCTCC AB2023176 TaxID=3342640 RepID=UPI0035D6C3E1
MLRRPLLAAPALLAAGPGLAQTQIQTQAGGPIAGGRPVRIVVPFPPGGAVDLLGRLLAERLGPALAQNVVVDNRGGAGGIIGADAVAKAAPDGTTLGIIGVTTFTAFPTLYARLPFDPAKDLVPLTQLTSGALLCVVNADTAQRRGWTDFRALIAWSKANPEGVKMGSSGTGTSSHLLIEAVNAATGARILHVPYRGGGPAINDLLAGNIDMMFDVTPALVPHVESGKFKALALSSQKRMSFLPQVPGLEEFRDLGLGDVDLVSWNALGMPAGVPAPVQERLMAAVRQVAGQADYVERLRPLGYDTVLSESPAAMRRMIERETPMWRAMVERAGVKLD